MIFNIGRTRHHVYSKDKSGARHAQRREDRDASATFEEKRSFRDFEVCTLKVTTDDGLLMKRI